MKKNDEYKQLVEYYKFVSERYHEVKASFRKTLIWVTVLHASFFIVASLLNDLTFITIGSIVTFASLLMMSLIAATW